MQSDLSISLNSIFSEREEGFLHSLQQALSAATTDKYIRQMFDDKLSANYVPDRICELIKFFLNDERELFVEELLRRLKALEACLGSERIKQLEEIGQRLMEVSQTQAQKEAEYRKCVQILNDQIGNFQENIGDELKIMKTNVSSLSNSTKSIFNTLQKFKLSLSSDFQDFKKQSRKLVKNLSNTNEKVNDQMKKIKSDNSNLMRQVNQLKEALDELRISKDNALRAQAEQFYSDISKLKEDFNNQRMEDLELNKQTENQMNQMRETLRNKFADKIQKIQQEAENAIKEMNVAHDNDVTALQKKVNRLNAKNNMLKDELSQSLNSINSLKNGQDVQIRKLQNKILKLSEQNEKNEADLSRKQEKIKKTQQENDKLNNEIQIINQKLLENDRMLQDAAKNLMQKQNEVDHNVFEKSKLIASKNEISQSLSNMNDELRNKDKELSQIQDKLDEVNKEKQSVIKEKEDIQSELNNLIKKAKKKDETIDQLSEKVKEIPKLQDEIDDLKGKNGKLEETKNENSENRQTIEKLQNQNKKLQASVNKLQNQIKDKDFELESKQNAIDSFEKENNEQTDLNTKLQTSLMQTKDQIRQKDKELNMLKQAIEEQQSMTQRQLFDLESMQAQVSQIPTLQNEKQDAIMKANLLERQNHELKSKINELQITIQQVRQQLHQIKAIAQAGPSKEELSRQIQSLLKENSTLKVKNKNLLGQLQSCQDELSSTKHHFDTTTSQFREKTRKLNELQNKLNSSQEIVNDSKLKIEDLTEKCSEYESSLKILAKKYQQKDKLIGSQKKSQNELRRKLQASEENNQKLSSSLSNVNNELLSLREELRNKNNENVQLKESLENNSMTARELTSTQRSLNDKISLLNNCEERNAALLRDIEKKEAKIGQLSDTLMEKDKEIQNLKQAQYTQKKQNETLTALTQDQQRQLDEGHRNLMKMQEEILRVQNEALSKGDSIKAIEVDHNREAEGRKQIQALINEDREKYRERITKLQDDNSSLLVEKAELEHKINQIKFENQTLSQLLESKESELSFEKERGNQDLLSTREMTSKIMVENKQLRQKLNDKEQYDKQLLAQIQEYIKSLINLDDIPELSRKMMETQEELQEICDTLNVKDPSEIPGEIDRIRDLNKALKANENKLHSLFPDNNADDIFNLISNLKKENSELQEMKSQLQQLTKSSNIIKSVQSLLLTIKAFDKRETELIRMIPNYEFENLTKDIAKLLKDNQKQNNLLEEIKIESGSSSIDSIPSIISEAINKLNFYTNIEKNLKQLIPISSMSEASDYIEKILKSDDELGLELSKANACIPSEYEGDLSSKISNLAKDNLENKSTIKSIIKGLPEHLQMTNDLSGTVSKIAHENEELKRQHKDILNTHLNNALQNNRELLKERNQIALNLNCTESDDLPEKTLEVIEEKNKFLQMVEEIEGILPKSSKGTDIFSRLKFLLKELENSQKVLKAIRHSIDSDDDHLINNVNNLVKKFADSENLLNEIESYFPPSHEILSDRVKYLIDNSNEMNEQLQALKNLFPKSNKDLQNDVANLLKEHNHVNQTIKQLNEIINGENNHDNIIEKAKEMKEKIEKGDQLLTKVKDILNDPTLENDNVPPSLQALVKHIQKLENKMKEIDGLLPKSKGQEDVVTKLKREKKRKEDLKKLLDNIINLLPHCSTEQEIERSLSEILEFLKSLYHLIYIQNIDKMKRVIKTDIKTQEADLLSIQCIEYEQIIDDLQHIFEEFQHNIVILSDFDQILPRNKDTNIINRLNKELQKKKQQEDLLNEIQKALSQRNHHTTDILSCLQEELALSNDLQDIVETLHSILPQNHDDRNRFEDDFDAEKREFNRSIIPKVQQEIDMKNSFQKKILEIENLLPKSKDDNLSNRLKKELDKKEQLQKQLDDLSSRFDHCKTFDDLSSNISSIQKQNYDLINILKNIEKCSNNTIDELKGENDSNEENYESIIEKVNLNVDYLKQIYNLIKPSKGVKLIHQLENLLKDKDNLQQTLDSIQSKLPEAKNINDIRPKIAELFDEIANKNEIIQSVASILPYNDEDNIIEQSKAVVQEIDRLNHLVNEIDSLVPKQKGKQGIIDRLKSEFKSKEKLQKKLEEMNDLMNSSKTSLNDPMSSLQSLLEENSNQRELLETISSILPTKEGIEENDIISQSQFAVDEISRLNGIIEDIERLLPTSKTNDNLISRLKKELEHKTKFEKGIENIQELLPTCKNINDLPTTISNLLELKELFKHYVSDIVSIVNQSNNNQRESEKEYETENEISDDYPENEGKEFLNELEKLMNEFEEMKTERRQIEELLPKINNKNKESLLTRLKQEFDKNKKNEEELQQLYSHFSNNDNISHILEEISQYRHEIEELTDIFKNEIRSNPQHSQEDLSQEISPIILAHRILADKKENENIIQEIDSILPDSKSTDTTINKVRKVLALNQQLDKNFKAIQDMFPDAKSTQEIISKIRELQELGDMSKDELDELYSIFSDSNDSNIKDNIEKLVKNKKELENKMKEIDGLLPKSKGQEDVVTKLKREKKRKEDLKKLLDNIINLLPHCSTEQEIERSLSEILEFLKSLYHLIYIQNKDQLKLISKYNIENESDLNLENIRYEHIIDDLQQFFKEYKRNMNILSDLDKLLPKNKDPNLMNRLNKELQKKKQQEDLLKEIENTLPQRNQSNVPLITRLKNELNLSNDLQDIINKIHSILPQYKENTNHFTNTEDEYESDNESIEDKNEFNRSIIPKVQQEIDMKNSFQKKILEIENLLPKSKDDNLSNRLKKELDKKEQLQKQLDDLSSRFDHCKTFDDLSSHISELLRNNSNLKNILYQIDGLFSEVQNKVINDYDEEDEKEKDDFSYLIQIIGQYIDNTNSLKRKLEEIESLLPKYKNQGDLVSRLKDEFNKKEKVQQLAGKLQNIIPGVKTPEELAKKVQKILQEKEIQKTIIEQLNDILPELSENRTSNYDEEEDDNQMIEIGHNLPKRSQDIMNKYNQMKTLLDAINNLLPQNNKNDLITKLKKELKNKDRVQQQMEKLNNLLDSTSGNGADLSSKLKDLIQENEEMKQQLDELDSTLPQTNEDDDLLTRIKKLIKSKENQDSLVTEIESTLPKSNNQLGIVSRIKNELKQKEKLQQQLDSLKSILNTPNNSDIINQYKEMAQDNSDMRRILDEANGLLSSHDEDIIPKIEKLLKQKEEQAQTIEDIEGILPKSKTKDSIVKRIQKELQKKDELHKQLESMKSVLPGNKLSGDISDYLKQLLDENNLLKQLNEEINDILPSGDEEMLAKIQNMTQENENLKKQVSEIDSLVPGSPSRENIVDKLKKEFKKNQKTQQNLNSLMSLLPEVSTPEELYVALQNIMTDNNIMKRDLENIGSIFAEGDEDLHSKVQSLMKENDGLNHLVNEIDSLVPKQKGKQGIIDRLKSEFKSKEKLQKKLEEMNDLMNSSKTSLNDPMSSLQSLLEENSNQRELLETISSILPTKEGIEENDIISQSQFAVDEISRLNGIIEDIERLLPTSKTNDNLISRLKKELEHKTKFEKGIENIQELLPTCKNINDLPTTISNLLELKELFKHYVSDIVSIVNQSNNNQRESEKEYETENEISDDYPENEGKEFLNELEKLMNEFEEMKTERRQIEELLPKINNKNKESLLTRLKQEFDKNKKNEEELQQLYSHFSNNDNISHILEEISQYRHEIEELTNMFESELSPQHNYSDYENDSVIELAKKVIDDKKENDKIISTLEKIIPMKDKKGDIVVNAKKLVDEYDNLMKHVNKIMKILPKSNSFDDITKSIQEIMDEKNELNNKMNQYQTIFPISNSLDDLENLHINENGVVEDIPTRLKRLIKEKKEVCELLGVPDDIKAAIDVLLDENKTLKKENGELYLIINQLKELFEVKSHSELVDAAIHQRETIESTSDLFVKLLEILAGPMNTSITLRLPISPQIKEKLWKILTEMKQKMNDTDEKIIHILTKAKRAGYEGIDPCDAVKFLEETATLYEQQRVNEFFHGQVSSIRELMNEQHKTYESTKNKYNRQAKEQKEMLLEMQEKFALREEEMMQECEDVNNQMIALKEELEKANKLKTEILRLACGQAADMEYLRSNMSRTENSLLKNAEKMRTIVAQVQARSANKKKSTKVQKKPQVEHLSVQPEKPTQ